MPEPTEQEKSSTLEYRSSKDDTRLRGATIAARAGAGLACTFFIWMARGIWLYFRKCSEGTPIHDPAFLVCIAGFAFCLCVALGLIGTHRRKK